MAELTLKKTMEEPVSFLEGIVGKTLTKELFEKFVNDYAIKTSGNSTGKPREATKLYDKDGNILGGKCRATNLWFAAENFNHHHGLSKEADNVKNRLNTEAKKIEKEAEAILEEARKAENAQDKLKLFEKYDAELAKAKKVRDREITLKDFSKEVPHFATVEDLAKALKVEVITSKPKAEKAEKEEAGE
jgi:hypothetical protein